MLTASPPAPVLCSPVPHSPLAHQNHCTHIGDLQAERWGSELLTEDVESMDLTQRPFTIRSADRTVRAHSVIIATGATAKRLNLPSEGTYWSKGISACAICDGASPLFKVRRRIELSGTGSWAWPCGAHKACGVSRSRLEGMGLVGCSHPCLVVTCSATR